MSQESILASWYKPGSPQKLPARTMPLGFYIIMAAQFFSALADNALLIVSIALLKDMQAPPQYEPMLKFFFTISYVALAAFVGAYADSMPKWRVMLISNTIKIGGCMTMLFGMHPLAWVLRPTHRPSTAFSPSTCPTACWLSPTAGSRA